MIYNEGVIESGASQFRWKERTLFYVVTANGLEHGTFDTEAKAAAAIGFNGWPYSKILTDKEYDSIKDQLPGEKTRLLETVGKRVNY